MQAVVWEASVNVPDGQAGIRRHPSTPVENNVQLLDLGGFLVSAQRILGVRSANCYVAQSNPAGGR